MSARGCRAPAWRPRSLPPPTTGVVVEGWSIRRCTRPWHVPEHPAVSLGGQAGDPLGRAARPDRRPGGGRDGEACRVVARLVARATGSALDHLYVQGSWSPGTSAVTSHTCPAPWPILLAPAAPSWIVAFASSALRHRRFHRHERARRVVVVWVIVCVLRVVRACGVCCVWTVSLAGAATAPVQCS